MNVSAKTGRSETSRRANSKIQECRNKGARGTQFPLAELRGGSFLSGCRGEASLHCGSRVQPRPGKSDENRHFVLGILSADPKAEKFSFDHPAVLQEGRF